MPSFFLHWPFSFPAARRRDRAPCSTEKNFWIAAITRRGGAIEDRHNTAGHERGGVELLWRRVATRRAAGGRRAGVSKRAEVRPRSGGGALQSRLPLAGAEPARRGADGIHGLHAAAQQHAGGLAQARCGATQARDLSPAEKSFSTALSFETTPRR